MIELKDVTIRYPEVLAVDSISMQFAENKIYGLVGPNGAGKTTLLQAIVGLITTYDGDILINGISLKTNRFSGKTQIGYAPEDTDLFPFLSAREYLKFIADIRKIDQAEETIGKLIPLLGLEEVADDIVDRYSHGMRKKLSLAGALLSNPQYLILDEALNGLDPLAMHNMRTILQDRAVSGKTILLSSHVLELVENWCDIIIVLNKGKIAGSFPHAEIASWRETTGKSFSDYFVQLIEESSGS